METKDIFLQPLFDISINSRLQSKVSAFSLSLYSILSFNSQDTFRTPFLFPTFTQTETFKN